MAQGLKRIKLSPHLLPPGKERKKEGSCGSQGPSVNDGADSENLIC